MPFVILAIVVCAFLAGLLTGLSYEAHRLARFHGLIARGETYSSAANQVYGK